MPAPGDTDIYDAIFDVSGGMDSSKQVLLLEKNQAAMLVNATVRGTFLQDRPKYRKIRLDFGNDVDLQSAVESGLWQGGGYFQPDYGNQSLLAAIAGRLFQFNIAGSTAVVSEKTVPGDPNPATQTIAWLWQSERWMIWNDGISLPVFFDGESSRRSYGPKVLLGTTAVNWTVPAIGASVTVTLLAPYTGPIGVNINVDDVIYTVTGQGTPGAFLANLENVDDVPASTVPVGAQIVVTPVLNVGTNTNTFALSGTSYTIILNQNYLGNVGDMLTFEEPLGAVFVVSVVSINGATIVVSKISGIGIGQPLPAGTPINRYGAIPPAYSLGNVVTAFTVPSVGGSGTVEMDQLYQGPNSQPVTINGKNYKITSTTQAPPAGSTLVLINVNDPPGVGAFTRGPTGSEGPGILTSIAELPAGRMGTYGMGRNWESLIDGKQFLGSDIVGGSSGSAAFNFRDAVLKVSENDFLAGGGLFTVPGSVGDIRFMKFTATLDASLGQGALQVGTPNGIFSCNAPVDRTTWQNLTNPILTQSLITFGGLGQNSTVNVNGDLYFRSIDGIRSLLLGRRGFDQPGNVPQSDEMQTILDQDDTSLLEYGSGIIFGNRLYETVQPTASNQGVFHQGLIAENFDAISSLRGKAPPVYDGLHTGLSVLQLLRGQFSGVERAFAFVLNTTEEKIELWEILPDGAAFADDGSIPVVWSVESSAIFANVPRKTLFDAVRILDGEVFIDDLRDRANIRVQYRPVGYPCWINWTNFSICSPTSGVNNVGSKPGYRNRIGFGEPSGADCDEVNNVPYRESHAFQLKVTVQGHLRILAMRFRACHIPIPRFARVAGCCDNEELLS